MAFWSKKGDKPADTRGEGGARPARSDGPDAGEAAIDAVGSILRAIGKTAFSLDGTSPESTARRFDAWARHILVRSRPPGRDEPSGSDDQDEREEEAPRNVDRDWPGVIGFVTEHRRRENQHVAETVSGLREAVRSFMRAATKLRQISGVADDSMKSGIDRLRKAVDVSAPVDLRREIMSVASELEVFVENRKRSELEITQMLAEKVRELTSQLEEAKKEGSTDSLTRLPNRRTLEAVLDELLELCQVTAQPVALALIDVDNFKVVNDSQGHVAGDQVLRFVADQLSRTFLRKYDLVSRFGGDEFCVLLRDTTAADAKRLLTKVSQAISAAPAVKGGPTVTISVGVVDMVLGDDPTALIERADKALYRAKNAGRNRIEVG